MIFFKWLKGLIDIILLFMCGLCVFAIITLLWPIAALGSETALKAMKHGNLILNFLISKMQEVIDNYERNRK